MSNPACQFPIIMFGPSNWYKADADDISMEWFEENGDFEILEETRIQERVGREIYDAAGNHFKITDVVKLRTTDKSWWSKLWAAVLGRHWVIGHELEFQSQLSFETLREKVAQGILGEPDRWRDDEAVAGESGEPRDEQEMLDALAARARAAPDFAALIQVLETGHPEEED